MGTDHNEWEAARREYARLCDDPRLDGVHEVGDSNQIANEVFGSSAPIPTICPTNWPKSIAEIPRHLSDDSASYACRDALDILNGLNDDMIRKAAFQIEQTFDWIGNVDELIIQGPNGPEYVLARFVLNGALQYMDYCASELPVSDVVDEELGPDADDAMLYAILAVSLFVQAAQTNFLETLEMPPQRPPNYPDIIGTACYAASEAKNRRAMAELRQRLSLKAEIDKAAERKAKSQEASAARHKEAREAKALVLKWWNEEGDYAKYRTKSAVYQKYADALEFMKLSNGGRSFKLSTLETWLAEGRDAEGRATG